MKKGVGRFFVVLAVGMLCYGPALLFAQAEHGGQEHAGQGEATAEHGGVALTPADVDPTATLLEAAAALDASDAALAADLRAWADGTAAGDQDAVLTQAADALQVSDPILADKLRGMVNEHGGAATV